MKITQINPQRLLISGQPSKENISEIIDLLQVDKLFTLDFAEVESLDFSVLRALLNAHQQGYRFRIVNVSDAVAILFETGGITQHIPICRKPVHISMDDYEQSGDGYTALSYNHRDGDSMMKLYYDFVPMEVIEQEKCIATAALQMGIPTPMAGPIVTDGKRFGVSFERIANKKSFARAIADTPTLLEPLAHTFAQMCKKLHATPCNTEIFPSVKDFYTGIIQRSIYINDAEKSKALDFLCHVPDNTTCLHGDLHIGNVITNGTDNLFIDMADFRYGNPLFDIGLMYLVSHNNEREMTMKLFHISNETFLAFWKIFITDYFGITDDRALAKKEEEIKPFAALKLLHFGELSKHLSENKLAAVKRWLC